MNNALGEKCQVTVILRLTFDEQETLLYGEVVALKGKVIGRFTDWIQLPQIIHCHELTHRKAA